MLQRLRRIEALERERAPARWLLAEVCELLAEVEEWLTVEGRGTELAAAAAERCRRAYEAGRTPVGA